MEDSRFDALAKTLSRVASRRDMVRVTVGSGIATTLAAVGSGDAGAKKKGKGKNKKKCKKPKVKCKKKCCAAGQACVSGKCTTPPAEECQFTQTPTLWTLQADCSTKASIAIPDGVTLDGNGKTIKLVTSPEFSGFGVAALGGNATVQDLTIDGSDLVCDDAIVAGLVLFNTSGTIENVTVQDIPCGRGIIVDTEGGGPAQTVDFTNVTIRRIALLHDAFPPGIEIAGDVVATIADSTFADVFVGVDIDDGVELTLEDSTLNLVPDVGVGVDVGPDTTATIRRNTFTTALIGIDVFGDSAVANVTENTITGNGPSGLEAHGVSFAFGASGSVSGNTISNFHGSLPGQISCGIFIADDAGDVTNGTNTFPDPPGNDQDVCDFS